MKMTKILEIGLSDSQGTLPLNWKVKMVLPHFPQGTLALK